MKILVAYKSKTGYTKKYAEWIAGELGCDIKENASLSDLVGYDMIIYGGGMYAGGLNGIKLIRNNEKKLASKKLVIFAVGANPGREHEITAFWDRLLTKEWHKDIMRFYLRGGFDYGKIGAGDKILMNMLKKHLQSLKNPSEDDLGMLKMYDEPFDFSDRSNIGPLIDYVRNNAD